VVAHDSEVDVVTPNSAKGVNGTDCPPLNDADNPPAGSDPSSKFGITPLKTKDTNSQIGYDFLLRGKLSIVLTVTVVCIRILSFMCPEEYTVRDCRRVYGLRGVQETEGEVQTHYG
jgi:hypothetical protein